MIRKKDILASLPLVASVLGERYGVEVLVGGSEAKTDGTTIYLPALPLDSEESLIALARGYIDHESAHIRHTDFEALGAAKLTSLEKHIWNCIEDWRVEHALADIYPGCGYNFRWLIRREFLEKAEKAGNNPAFSILNWILLTLRSWDVPELQERCEEEARMVEASYPGLLPRIKAIVLRIPGHCSGTGDSLVYAGQIADLLQGLVDMPEEDDGRNEDKPPAPDGDTGGEPEISSSGGRPLSKTARKNLKRLLEAKAEALPQNLGERLAAELDAHGTASGPNTVRVAVLGHLHSYPLTPDHLEQSARACRVLRTRLQGLLQAQSLERCLPGRRGKLNPTRLYRLATGNPQVFLRRGHRQSLDTAVHILLDVSGSMCHRIGLATASCHALALALEGLPGVNVGVSAFPANAQDPDMVGVCPLVRHRQRVHPIFSVDSGGGTPLGECLWWAMQRMLPLKEARKLILVITDGEPDTRPPVIKAIEQASGIGMEIYGVGIDAPNVGTLFPRWLNVSNMEELAPALFHTLQKALLRPERTSLCG